MIDRSYRGPFVGKRVRVLYSEKYDGIAAYRVGEIRSVFTLNSIGVKLDHCTNQGSKHGYFYFTNEELEFIEEPETNIKEGETQMQKITNYLNIAEIEFLDDKANAFRTIDYANFDPALQAGDTCVVMTAHRGLALANVVAVRDETDAELCREIVARVDLTEYKARVDLRKKAAELKAKMQERAKQLQDLVLYQTLAKEDPEMAQLLDMFKGLGV